MKTVSIIVPVYNAEVHLKRCIESLLAQTYSDIEIILVDDGATDTSPQICDEFAVLDDRIVVIHKKNGGVSNARNMGIETAKGEYIQFADSDDWLSEDYTEKLVAGMEKNHAELVIGGMVFVQEHSEEIRHLKEDIIDNKEMWGAQFGVLYKEYYLNSTCNKLFIKDKITEQFREDIYLGEDCCFVLGYLKNISRIQLIADYGYYYQMESLNSLTKRYSMKEFEYTKLLYKLLRAYSTETFGEFVGKREVSYIFLQDLRRLLVEVNNREEWKKKEKIKYLRRFATDPVFLDMRDEVGELGFNQRILFGLLRKKYFSLLLLMMKIAWRNN